MLPQKATDIGSVLSNINSQEQEQEQDEGKKTYKLQLNKVQKADLSLNCGKHSLTASLILSLRIV